MKKETEEFEWYYYIIFALVLIFLFSAFTTPFERLVLSVWIYCLIYTGVLKVLKFFLKERTLFIRIFENTFGLPVKLLKVLFYSFVVFMQITVFLVVTFGLLPSVIMANVSEKYYLGALYLGVLLSVVLFAYFGEVIWKFIKKYYGNNSESKLIKQSKNIAIMYIVMISVYIICNFVEFSKLNISNFIEPTTFLVLKEVLVTFIAIDGLRQLFKKIEK